MGGSQHRHVRTNQQHDHVAGEGRACFDSQQGGVRSWRRSCPGAARAWKGQLLAPTLQPGQVPPGSTQVFMPALPSGQSRTLGGGLRRGSARRGQARAKNTRPR